MTTVSSTEEFVAAFARALQARDASACSALWGRAGIVLADRFEAIADEPRELEPFLAGAWPIYDFLDLARVEHRILEAVALTDSIERVLVRYSFFDAAGAHLTDGDFEYVLRREEGRLRCHVGVNVSAEPNLTALALSRGYLP